MYFRERQITEETHTLQFLLNYHQSRGAVPPPQGCLASPPRPAHRGRGHVGRAGNAGVESELHTVGEHRPGGPATAGPDDSEYVVTLHWATAAGGPERTRMAGVYQALDRDKLLGCVTHLCPRGPAAHGLGPTGVRRGTLDKAWLEQVEGADIRRGRRTWAVGQECVVGNADPNHGSDP